MNNSKIEYIIEGTTLKEIKGKELLCEQITDFRGTSLIKKGKVVSIVIPSEVTIIDDGVFQDCTSLEKVLLPSSLKTIGSQAFKNCKALYCINIPSSIVEIGKEAFKGTDVREIKIPSNVTEIGKDAFYNCRALESINVDDKNPNYKSIEGVLYDKSGSTLICAPCYKNFDDFVIPRSVNSIEPYAFSNCWNLYAINIPASVSIIGEYSFAYCSNLKNVHIDYDVERIEQYAFNCCSSLKHVSIERGITYIGERAFAQCESLTDINIPNTVLSIGFQSFWHCNSLERIALPASVTKIEGSFWEMRNLNSIDVSENNPKYKSINGILFDKEGKTLISFPPKKGLIEYEIPEHVKVIGNYAFFCCFSLRKLCVHEGLRDIGHYAFRGCCRLYYINIPESVVSIEDGAFEYCKAIKRISLPNIRLLKEKTFHGCKSLEEVTMPDTVESIGFECFCNCQSLKNIKLSNLLKQIDSQAFYGCSKLESIVLPDSISTIGKYAFGNCIMLKHVSLSNSLKIIWNYLFVGCESLEQINIPSSVLNIKGGAFHGCMNLKHISFEHIAVDKLHISKNAFDQIHLKCAVVNIPVGLQNEYKKHCLLNRFTIITDKAIDYKTSHEICNVNIFEWIAELVKDRYCTGIQLKDSQSVPDATDENCLYNLVEEYKDYLCVTYNFPTAAEYDAMIEENYKIFKSIEAQGFFKEYEFASDYDKKAKRSIESLVKKILFEIQQSYIKDFRQQCAFFISLSTDVIVPDNLEALNNRVSSVTWKMLQEYMRKVLEDNMFILYEEPKEIPQDLLFDIKIWELYDAVYRPLNDYIFKKTGVKLNAGMIFDWISEVETDTCLIWREN